MPLKEEYIDFDEEIQRLEQKRDALAEQVAALDEDVPKREGLAEQGQDIDVCLRGLRWARDDAATDDGVPVWSDDVDGVTLAGLTGGEFGHVEDTVVADALDRGDTRVGEGLTRIYYVAKATQQAPYVDGSMSFTDSVQAVSQLPVPFLKWADDRVDELTTIGGDEGNSFGDLVAEKQANQDET
ncbi:hypothetical protein [Halorussus marinus]|uniref:hypothetical protein n=1 Tax=Halorussus marinus TaxID=2505976 RepID=UPI0010931164|nr:hypothetical protein [Halorussus marinus]